MDKLYGPEEAKIKNQVSKKNAELIQKKKLQQLEAQKMKEKQARQNEYLASITPA